MDCYSLHPRRIGETDDSDWLEDEEDEEDDESLKPTATLSILMYPTNWIRTKFGRGRGPKNRPHSKGPISKPQLYSPWV